jgi:hypothetical protein
MKSAVLFIVFVIVCAAGLWAADVFNDRSYKLSVVEPAPLYSMPPTQYPQTNPIILTLKPGEPIQVLRLRYGKDFEAFQVETSKGVAGWVIGGEGVKVVSRG